MEVKTLLNVPDTINGQDFDDLSTQKAKSSGTLVDLCYKSQVVEKTQL